MSQYLLIKDGEVVFPDKIIKSDILIKEKKIKKISPKIEVKNCFKVIDAKGRYVLPGAIDVHTHMELESTSGMISSDDYLTGSRAGLKCGVTTFFGFAYQRPNESLIDAYKRTYESASKKSVSNFYLHAGILNTDMNYEKQIKECVKIGVRSFKLHLNDPKVDNDFLTNIFHIASFYDVILLLHCEDGKIVKFNTNKLIKNKKVSLKYFPLSRKNFVEKIAIDTVITLAKEFKTKIYIVHLTTKEGLESIKRAKEEGNSQIECETCPQYLLLTDKIYKLKEGYLYTCTPPFRSKNDNDALWQGLKEGIIKIISTDHCPFKKSQKYIGKKDFTKLPFGIPGIETLYHLILSEGIKRGFQIYELVNFVSTNPAKFFKIYPERGIIRENSYADLVIYNPDVIWRIDSKELITNCDFTPYENFKIKGKIEKVIFEGEIVNL